MKSDITTNEDVKLMVNLFYDKIKTDMLLNHIFTEVMDVNWDKHLVKMYAFWEFIIFHTGEYGGRPFPPHLQINDKVTLTDKHFSHWIELFNLTIDENFTGENAMNVKTKAANIKSIWNHKLNSINNN